MPCALQEGLPQGHLAYFISDTVDTLNLSAFHARYAGGDSRNQPFHPVMLVKVLVYAYATGVFSSRKIAKKLHEDVAFRVLGADNFPAHRTIRDFRALHLAEFTDLFVQVVRLAREMGLVKLGTIAVDGTKVKANASRHKAMSHELWAHANGRSRTQSANHRAGKEGSQYRRSREERTRSGRPCRDRTPTSASGCDCCGQGPIGRASMSKRRTARTHTRR